MRVLISTSDKTGLADFAKRLHAAGAEFISTGGTAKVLRDAGLPVTEVSEVTGYPELLGGRVKTLHPAVHAAILARRDNPQDMQQLEEQGIQPIDMVVVNLYPFDKAAASPDPESQVLEQVDIGGVTLIRAAAKNWKDVAVVCEPADYQSVAVAVEQVELGEAARRDLAYKAFHHTARYDATISAWFAREREDWPPVLSLGWPLETSLRYGENPHQRAAVYREPASKEPGIMNARQIHGKEISYNNLMDADGALEAARDFLEFGGACCVLVKHGNPCGIALGKTGREAFEVALETDPDSPFGGIVAMTAPVDEEAAEALSSLFLEVICAPRFEEDALKILQKKKNLRLLETGKLTPRQPGLQYQSITGGMLAMDRDVGRISAKDLKIVTKKQASPEDLNALLFSWRVVKWVKSNAIVYCRKNCTIGIGAGQMSRVDAAKFGSMKARRSLDGSYMGSDAFFPFRDGVDAAARHGVKAIIQPGGSVRDAEVIEAANQHGMIMAFTGMRHFRH